MEDKKLRFKSMQLHVQENDVITSKMGILMESIVFKETYLVKKVKVRDGFFEIMGNKELMQKMEVHKVEGK